MNLKSLPIETIEKIMDNLTVDISFVDANDTVKYFNSPKRGRIFPRTKMDIGRKVQNCHPKKSLDMVNKILDDFKAGKREDAPFWLQLGDKFIYINYFPVRDNEGNYLGTLEVTQDITELRKLEGQKRLLDD
ncbi:MAG TPA: DUF438 domain-containing protein [Bacteroidetes bacterium]|uniref:Diguanylate cyclase n=1 Tax=candidate division TA06 bacterium TaxID=2250710 RepID=A0A660S7T3_UNCT6|nr:MAG: diguanylate cyclase [candidate division TA06 bacterium]HHD82511.1 DUF438 domain-containing protein [Bacteroidota bacterium]